MYTALSFQNASGKRRRLGIGRRQSLILMCPHTTIYVSSYYYICVMCPHTAMYVSSVNDGVLALGDDSLILMCVLILLCPHTTVHVSSYYYKCVLSKRRRLGIGRPQSLILMCVIIRLYVSSYYYTCVIILLYTCPHTTIYVSSVNDGVLALGDHSVRIYSRGCVPLATISVPEDAQGLMCMDLVPQTASLVCGGSFPHLTGSDVCRRMLTYADVC